MLDLRLGGHREGRHGVMGNQFGWTCPSCQGQDDIAVRALVWCAQTDEGSDPDGHVPDHDHYWDDTHDAQCMACGWQGKVYQL
jgi:hypothetical protein